MQRNPYPVENLDFRQARGTGGRKSACALFGRNAAAVQAVGSLTEKDNSAATAARMPLAIQMAA